MQRTRHKSKGRVAYIVQMPAPEVMAAISFHVDQSRDRPLVASGLAIRTDGTDARAVSRAAAIILIAYLVEASVRDGRPAVLGLSLERTESDEEYRAIGFQPRPAPAGLIRSGQRYFEARSPLRP